MQLGSTEASHPMKTFLAVLIGVASSLMTHAAFAEDPASLFIVREARQGPLGLTLSAREETDDRRPPTRL
jgi:hypothetical protein